jgi:hypothetical protein
VPGTAAGWSATHRPARKGTAGCQNTPYTTYDPKGVLKKAGCNTAGDAHTALNEYMYWLLEQGAKHAKANGRKTVRAHERPTRRRLAAALGHMLAALGTPAQGRKRAAAEVDRFHAAKSSAS